VVAGQAQPRKPMRITSRRLRLFLSILPSLLCTSFRIAGHHGYHTLTMSVLGQGRLWPAGGWHSRSTPAPEISVRSSTYVSCQRQTCASDILPPAGAEAAVSINE
jgi:hypothetical protein